MKMVSFVLAVLLSTTLLLSGNVYALDSCVISNTGPGSTNECELDDDFKCEVKNDTEIDFDNDSDQNAGSGDASVDGNTSGGSATSGSASNSNSTQVEIDVTNGNPCLPTTTTTTPPTPPEGGRGAGQVSGASTVAGGRGAGVQQVAAPVGGVGAGAGGMALPAVVVSLLTAAVGARHLHRLANA